MKLSKFLIIALLLSVLLLGCPVLASEVLSTWSSTSMNEYMHGLTGFWIPNATNYKNVTDIEFDCGLYYGSSQACWWSEGDNTNTDTITTDLIALDYVTLIPIETVGEATVSWEVNFPDSTNINVHINSLNLDGLGDMFFIKFDNTTKTSKILSRNSNPGVVTPDLMGMWQYNLGDGTTMPASIVHEGTYTILGYVAPPAPVCSFTASPTSGASPLTVTFNDTSTNAPTMWQWIVAENSTGYTVTTSTLKDWIGVINGQNKIFDVYLNAANGFGSCTAFAPNYLITTGATTGYAITVAPADISYLGNAIGTIVSGGGDMSKITDISWSWADSTGSYDFNTNGNTSRPLDYTKIGATWYGYEVGVGGLGGAYTLNMGATMPNGLNLNNLSSPGLKTVTCFIGTSDHLWYTLTAPLTVDSSGMQTLTVQAKDFTTGSLVAYTNLAVKNVATGIWSNVTASGGTYNFLYPYNTNLYIEATAGGYAKTTKYWTTTHTATDLLWLIMYSGATPAAANVTVRVYVYDAYNNALIPGALVHVYNGTNPGESKLTSGAGVAEFNTPELTPYTIGVTKYGYQAGGLSINTGPGGAIIDEVVMMHRALAPTPTVTVPTAVPSNVPTMVGGNYTGFWGPFYNMFGAMGANALTTQLLMACFFVFCGVVVGGFGMGTIIPGAPFSSTGGEAGGVFAFVLACAFGFISILWIVVIFVWLAFRYFLISR